MMLPRRFYIIWLLGIGVIAQDPSAFAGESLFFKEANLIGGYSSRERWVDKSPDQVSSVGFEDYRKFSNDYGDFLTTDVQARIAYDSTLNSNDAWALQLHNAWLLYKVNSATKIRFGHFSPAFGLEPQVDTHATLFETQAMDNAGFDRDWGLGVEGSFSKFDYKTALQLGSGMSVYRRDDSFLLSTRVGTPSSQNLQGGISLLYGQVLHTMGMNTFPRADLMSDTTTLMKRLGLDSQYLVGPFLFKGEVAYGTDDHKNVLGYLGEIDYTLPEHQNVEIELQFKSWINELERDSSDDSTAMLGASYRFNQNVTFRIAYAHDFNRDAEKEEDKILLQYYFYGR